MISSLFSGVSGLRNHQTRMDVLGNNIANVNTIGFKGSRATFQESLVQTMQGAGRPTDNRGGTNAVQLGLGMSVASIDNIHSQGGLESTGKISDMAIQGSGYFILADGSGGQYFTRAGNFGFDANGTMINPANGMFVQGKMADSTGEIPATAQLGNITVPFGQQDPPNATSSVTYANNLDSNATDSTASLQSAGTTKVDTVTGKASDGAGGVHEITVAFTQQAEKSDNTGIVLGGATESTTIGSLGVTAAGLGETTTISVDNGTSSVNLTGLTVNSTIGDVITQINAVDGVTAYWDNVNEYIVVERDFAGDGASYNVQAVSTTAVAPAGETVCGVLLDATATFDANDGVDHDFTATDVFTPTGGAPQAAVNLGIEVDPVTGLPNGISEIGGGGITCRATAGLDAGTLKIETEDTQHAMSTTVYDSQGGKHTLVTTFTKTNTDNKWNWQITLNGDEVVRYGDTGSVTFNPDGSLLNFSSDSGTPEFSFDPNNGGEDVVMDLNPGSTGMFDGLTGFSSNSTAAIVNQDGYGMGILDSITVDDTGMIYGIFTNGISRELAQVQLAGFNNESGLMKQGQSMYVTSANSGDPIIGTAGETISATISSGALETSNIDLAAEFTGMITAQRGFQANARVITTSDTMLDELVNLKR
ncbi:MAG: flagellar hook-basal body complex protein [candidate division Zixibacteria bacterium]|nr:flagellar hook-basal body complex protein [candidate division Zixibacteria bacterium]